MDNRYLLAEALEDYALAYEDPGKQAPIGFMA